MAIAELHNVSAFGPFFGESQRNIQSTRASSVLRMWQELEGDHVVSPSYRSRQRRNNSNPDETDNHHMEDNNSVASEQSSDLGENEQRHIFRELTNNGPTNRSDHTNDKGDLRSKVSEACSQVVQVCDGARRRMRRLYGRQTLIDLLTMAQRKREDELHLLSEQKPVSEFAHRNRIQALLRGRFLRDERSISEKRPSSIAETELDFLRQRQTVSDLREEFLPKQDNTASSSSSNGNTNESESMNTDDKNVREIRIKSDSSDTTQQESLLQLPESENQCSHESEGELEVYLHVEIAPWVREERVLEREATEQEVSSSSAVEHIVSAVANESSSLETDDRNHSADRLDHGHNNNNEETDNYDEARMSFGFTGLEQSGDQDIDQRGASSHEDDWASHDLQEADVDTQDEVGASLGRFHSFLFSDDDGDIMEIRELASRRRVSSLLGSSFRDSLVQVLQSHVERQAHPHLSGGNYWEEEEETAPPSLIEPDDDLSSVQSERNQFSWIVTESNPHWDDDEPLHRENLFHEDSNRVVRKDWEVIINGLRIDMGRLQQRMNNMQSMIEDCIDMQMQLQREVRQEVSAALKRSISTRGTSKNNMLDNESQWDYLKKGICCLCSDAKISSLLYRCGHACTCTECAETLVRDNGNCPMCLSPVFEAVRPYFI